MFRCSFFVYEKEKSMMMGITNKYGVGFASLLLRSVRLHRRFSFLSLLDVQVLTNVRLIESNAKCCYLKKFTCKGTMRQVFYLSEAPSPPMIPYSPPFTHCREKRWDGSGIIYRSRFKLITPKALSKSV
jgi:hypothetical protein